MKTTPSPEVVISGSGVWTPPNIITNEELVDSYNAYAEKFNADNEKLIASGKIEGVVRPTINFKIILRLLLI